MSGCHDSYEIVGVFRDSGCPEVQIGIIMKKTLQILLCIVDS